MTHYNEKTKQSFVNKTKNIIIKVVAEINSLLSGEFRKAKELEFNIISGNVSWLILRPLHLPILKYRLILYRLSKKMRG